ncbi:SDR family NAD(P)-dependent oxidoreductase [Nocardia sp. BSTN01]|uniref:SDR family NAD(P)-dependent oxidoreductase n=1 Tax=Nocardia sp. BSTN01 TaxID=2783665 RepID=UPI002814C8F5|nr:SDR family NAD(P)-dependent oxidoreductase [Nocardia sp. BSTN01]
MTGASAGIGRAFAIALATEGFSVTVVARDADRLAALVGELGPGHDHLAADLATAAGVAAVARLLHRGGYAMLVNNAGTAVPGDFTEVAIESSLATIDLNCRAVVTVVLTSPANRLWTTAMRLLPRRTALTLLAD